MKALHHSHVIVIVAACLLVLGFTVARGDEWPELTFTSTSFLDPPNARAYVFGSPIKIRCSVQNRSDKPASTYDALCYLREGGNKCTRPHLIGSVTRIPMPPHNLPPYVTDTFTMTLTLPDDLPPRWYNVDVIAVCAEFPGCDYFNSTEVGEIGLLRPIPDLTVLNVNAEGGRYAPGAEIKVKVSVKNVGGGDPGTYAVQFSTDGYSLGLATRDSLACYEIDTFETVCVFPSNLPDGEYAIEATAICDGDDIPDNDSGRDDDLVWVGMLPDLTVQRVEATKGTYGPGDDIVVYSLVENISDRPSANYTLDYYVSPDPEITSHDYPIGYVEREGLAPGQKHSYETTCHLPSYIPAGDCYIGAIITCLDDGVSQNDTGRDDATVTLVHPAGYICGRILYQHRDPVPLPIRYAQVEIYEGRGQAGEPEIARTFTDGNGCFGVAVPHEGDEDRRVYVKVRAQGVSGACPGTTSTIGDVQEDVFKRQHYYPSEVCDLPAHASLVIDVTVPSGHGAFIVYDSIVEGFLKAREFLGVELDPITTYWPSSYNATFYVPGEAIYIAREDRTDRDVILHEYGHYLAEVCDFAQGSIGDYPQHYWDVDLRFTPWHHSDEHALNFAFREAWPTLFSIATQYGDTGYTNSGDTKYQDYVEWARWTFEIDLETDTAAHSVPGKYYENMNCCVLWDIFDDHDDAVDNNDVLSDPLLTKIWTVTRECHPNDIEDFWYGWFEHFDDEDAVTRIFQDHGMPFHQAPTSPVDEFETGDFSIFDWADGPDTPWFVTSEEAHQGAYCARSGAIAEDQSSTLKVEVPCDSGQISFWVKVSSEANWDKLKFYIDGSKEGEWSGELDWEQVSYPVEAGTHTFMWMYSKSSFFSVGADTVWIDDVAFPTAQRD